MHRSALLTLLSRYRSAHAEEGEMISRIEELVRNHSDCLLRSCVPGHITASTWIVSPDRSRILLTHHRKLNRWLQLGGHVDGESVVHLAALREAQEESGMEHFEFLPANDDVPLPLDVDVHQIPAHGNEPAHEHHDIRFLLIAGAGQSLRMSDESNDLRWFPIDEIPRLATDDSVLRMARKAAHRLTT